MSQARGWWLRVGEVDQAECDQKHETVSVKFWEGKEGIECEVGESRPRRRRVPGGG